ncbi:hypothetical protein ACJBQZ_08870, partial [Streptococcus suis]
MGLFVYTQKGSIISTVDLPTTEIIEPIKIQCIKCVVFFYSYSSKIKSSLGNEAGDRTLLLSYFKATG